MPETSVEGIYRAATASSVEIFDIIVGAFNNSVIFQNGEVIDD